VFLQTKNWLQKVAEKNVLLTVEQIRLQSVLLESMIKQEEIGIIGGMYDVETGQVTFFDPVGINTSDCRDFTRQQSESPKA